MRRAVLSSIVFVFASCGGAEGTGSYSVVVHATRSGAPLAGVEITEGGYLVGATGADGALELAVDRPEGTRIELGARCPEGYRARPEHLETRLRELERPGGGSPPLELAVRCVRRVREIVVVVDAGQSNLPVLVDGRVVERTDATGLAHLWVEQTPGQRFAVRIDTSARPDLLPASPEQHYTVGADDDVLYWDPSFGQPEDDRQPRRRRRARRVHEQRQIERIR
jgi:hypothetical protein